MDQFSSILLGVLHSERDWKHSNYAERRTVAGEGARCLRASIYCLLSYSGIFAICGKELGLKGYRCLGSGSGSSDRAYAVLGNWCFGTVCFIYSFDRRFFTIQDL